MLVRWLEKSLEPPQNVEPKNAPVPSEAFSHTYYFLYSSLLSFKQLFTSIFTEVNRGRTHGQKVTGLTFSSGLSASGACYSHHWLVRAEQLISRILDIFFIFQVINTVISRQKPPWVISVTFLLLKLPEILIPRSPLSTLLNKLLFPLSFSYIPSGKTLFRQ